MDIPMKILNVSKFLWKNKNTLKLSLIELYYSKYDEVKN
jgi:hypothetical protein